jgi:hypothetical protein
MPVAELNDRAITSSVERAGVQLLVKRHETMPQ